MSDKALVTRMRTEADQCGLCIHTVDLLVDGAAAIERLERHCVDSSVIEVCQAKSLATLTAERDEAIEVARQCDLRACREKAQRQASEDRLEDERDAERRVRRELAECLQWCIGSDDFGHGGKAREGWLKGPACAIAAAAALDKEQI